MCLGILKEDPGNFLFLLFLLSLLNSIGPQEGFASEIGNLELFSMKTSDQSSVSQGLSKTLRGLGSTQ